MEIEQGCLDVNPFPEIRVKDFMTERKSGSCLFLETQIYGF